MDAYSKRLSSGDKTEGVAAALNFGGARSKLSGLLLKKTMSIGGTSNAELPICQNFLSLTRARHQLAIAIVH